MKRSKESYNVSQHSSLGLGRKRETKTTLYEVPAFWQNEMFTICRKLLGEVAFQFATYTHILSQAEVIKHILPMRILSIKGVK